MYSLIDAVDSESIAEEFDIGKFNKTHDFDNHIKIAAREGLDPSDSLKELEETTDSDDEMKKMAASTFSRCTNDRDSARSFNCCLRFSIHRSYIINEQYNGNASNTSFGALLPLMQQISN